MTIHTTILSRRQIRLLVPLGLAISLSLPGDQTLYAVLPTQAQAVGISLGVVGVLLGINRFIRIPGNPIAGLLNDRLGRRRLFLLGLLLGTLSTASYAFARGFPEWVAGRLLWGIAWSLLNVGGLTMVLDVTDEHDRGRVIGLYQLSYLIGLAFSPLLGGLLSDALGFRPALLVCAAISGAGLAITFFTLPETRPDQAAVGSKQSLRDLVAALKRSGVRLIHTRAPRRPSYVGRAQTGQQLAVNYIYLMTFFAGNGVVMSTISLYLKQNFGAEVWIGGAAIGVATMGGILLALRSLVGMVAGPLSGHVSDRRADRWSVVRVGVFLGMVGFGVLILGQAMWTVPLGVILVALSSGALLTTLAALTGDMATSDQQGRAIGRLATAGDLGSAAGPLLAYSLLAVVELRWVYLLCSLGFASSLLAVRYAAGGKKT
jgi:MFS family permease